jgi:uncharacterized damage-inducible protein DinB
MPNTEIEKKDHNVSDIDIFRRQLTNGRQMTERYLEDFQTPEQWTLQVHDQANHALWVVGHLAHTDNFLISLIDPSRAVQQNGWGEKFGMGSRPTGAPEDYPPAEKAIAYLRERRGVLLDLLENLAEADLERATPEGAPDFLATVRDIFELASWHEALHVGQLTVARRKLGHLPLVDQPPK